MNIDAKIFNKIHNLSFDEYNKMCHSVFEFAEKYLTIEEFNKK